MNIQNKIVTVENLSIGFKIKNTIVTPVTNVSYTLAENEVLGIVGESGCGKSLTATSLMGLLPPTANINAKVMTFNNHDLLTLKRKAWQDIRGKEISMIFQEPMSALNPLMKVGKQIDEMLRLHTTLSKADCTLQTKDMMSSVGLKQIDQLYSAYPHELSGGMLQRIMIAMALILEPKVLIADEPTTALDVTIQYQILELMRKLKQEKNTSFLFISHDLGVVKDISDRVMVMYLGYVVEEGTVDDVINNPQHPYTNALLQSIPTPQKKGERLYAIEGTVPSLTERNKGCPFYDRCTVCEFKCKDILPPLVTDGTHSVRCIHAKNAGGLK